MKSTNFIKVLIMRAVILLTILSFFAGGYASAMQPRDITGQITDEMTEEPLPGVNIIIEGTTIGTATDPDGRYSIQVPDDDAVLVFTFVGFVTQRIPVEGRNIIDVQLGEDFRAIDELVVIGYGAQQRESVVGSVAAVSDRELQRRSGVYNLAQAISGQIGGVTVMQTTGEPGAEDPDILIRGMSTWNESSPLILVDGIERRMNDIDISEVASISVLKDASATAVFGVKGANGVILINTKRGEEGQMELSFSANHGFKAVSRQTGVMEAYTAQGWKNEAIEHEISAEEASWQYYIPYEIRERYKLPQEDPYTYLYPNVDWQDEMFRDWGRSSRYNLNLRGGSDVTRYFASVGYTTEGDLLKSDFNERRGYDPGFQYDRFNFRANLDFDMTSSTVLLTSLSGFLGTRKGTNANFGGGIYDPNYTYGHVWRGVYELAPDAFPVRYPDGNYGKDPAALNMNNPRSIVTDGGVKETKRRQVVMDVTLRQELDFITQGLSAAVNVSYDTYAMTTGGINDGGNAGQGLYTYMDPEIINATTRQDSLDMIFYFRGTGPMAEDYVVQPWWYAPDRMLDGNLERALFYQANINYERNFDNHAVSGLFLFNRRENARGGEFANFREDWVGRVTYNYDYTYFAEFNAAYNGSEKFSRDYRFGFFPSMALGWMVSNESFMEDMTWLTLKIRGSYGQVGSDAGIPRWGYVSDWEYKASGWDRSTYTFDENGRYQHSPYNAYLEGTIANLHIRWETATKRNIGTELSLFDRIVTLEIDYYKDNRENIFMTAARRNIPNIFGAPAVPANLGKTESQGFEIEMGLNKTWASGFGVWARLGMTHAKDVIIESEDPILLPDYQKLANYPIAQHRTQIRDGFMNNWDDVYASVPATSNMGHRLPGDFFVIDFNADGIIDTYDSAPYAYPRRPQKTYNSIVGMRYNDLSFMVQFYGTRNIILNPPMVNPGRVRWTAVSERLDNYWSPDNIDADYRAPRLATSTNNANWNSVDASYWRIKTLEISYIVPFNPGVGISNFRVYITGNNLFYWSEMPVDYETGSFSIQQGYPTYRSFTLGLDVTF